MFDFKRSLEYGKPKKNFPAIFKWRLHDWTHKLYFNSWYFSFHQKWMTKMMMNCFCGMVDRLKTFSLISSWDHFQRSSPSQISDTPRAEFEPVQNLTPGFVEWSCAEVITITPRRHSPYFSPSFKFSPFFFKYCSLCDSNGIRTHNHLVRRQVRTP